MNRDTFSERRERRLAYLRRERRERRRRRLNPIYRDVEPEHTDQDEAYAELFSDLGFRKSDLSIRAARRLEREA